MQKKYDSFTYDTKVLGSNDFIVRVQAPSSAPLKTPASFNLQEFFYSILFTIIFLFSTLNSLLHTEYAAFLCEIRTQVLFFSCLIL